MSHILHVIYKSTCLHIITYICKSTYTHIRNVYAYTYRTVSTICSRILGPATSPLLVTCPTSSTQLPVALANCTNRAALSLVWVIVPVSVDLGFRGLGIEGLKDVRVIISMIVTRNVTVITEHDRRR